MAWSNSLDWDQLQPTWVACDQGSGDINETVYTYNYNTKLWSNNGNNGPNMSGWVKGVARGAFKIQFKLGYLWGWSIFYMANQSTVSQNSPNSGYAVTAASGINGLRFWNNNSNNKFFVDKNVNGTTTRIEDTTGKDDTMISLWRDASNVVKYKVGSDSTVTVGTFTDIFVFGYTSQSPSSCEILTAQSLDQYPS